MGSINVTTPDRPIRRLAIAIAATLALAACSGGDDDDAAGFDEPAAAEDATFDMADAAEMSEAEAAGGDRGSIGTVGQVPADGGFDIGVVGRDVIIEMRVVMSSDDIQRSVASVTSAASRLGGGIASSDVRFGTGDTDDGSAVLVVKVPPDAVDRLLDGLADTGTVQSISQSAQDVTEQLVDLDVRIANARTSVDNVREFMSRTENLNELVTLEAELTRRQTDLEQLEARQRNLADRVALSTVTIEIVPSASVPEPVDDDRSISDAFASGWEAFATFLFGIGFVVAASAPFVALGLVIAVAAWIWTRRRDAGGRNTDRPVVPAPTESAAPAADPESDPADDHERAAPVP